MDNGATWVKLDTVGDITLDYDANDPTVTGDKNPSVSIYKAVVKLPGSSEDTVQLRITIPGGKDDGQGYVWPGLDYGNADHRIGTVVVSAHDLSQYKTIDQVPEFKTPVLAPGIYDDLEDDFYYDFHIRSTWKDGPDYNWNTAEGYAQTFVPQTSDGWEGWTALIGRFMGQVIPKAYKTEAAWNGSAMLYEVEAGQLRRHRHPHGSRRAEKGRGGRFFLLRLRRIRRQRHLDGRNADDRPGQRPRARRERILFRRLQGGGSDPRGHEVLPHHTAGL